ncbi:MAG: Lrp/AsnC family transcriptional regulator [Chloroflexota bacterium]|nr:Lrp/AsnC family transcriptional regulator [Chloroflexota bacterium]
MADGEQPRDLRPTEGADATSRLLEELLAEGKPVAEIAVRLGISVPDAHARIRGVPPGRELEEGGPLLPPSFGRAEPAGGGEGPPLRTPGGGGGGPAPRRPSAPEPRRGISRRAFLGLAAGVAGLAAGGAFLVTRETEEEDTVVRPPRPVPVPPTLTPVPPALAALQPATGIFKELTLEPGQPLTEDHGIFFLRTRGEGAGSMTGWQVAEPGNDPPVYQAGAGRRFIATTNALHDRTTGRSWTWSEDRLRLIGFSDYGALFEVVEEELGPHLVKRARYVLTNGQLEERAEFELTGTLLPSIPPFFDPSGRRVFLALQQPQEYPSLFLLDGATGWATNVFSPQRQSTLQRILFHATTPATDGESFLLPFSYWPTRPPLTLGYGIFATFVARLGWGGDHLGMTRVRVDRAFVSPDGSLAAGERVLAVPGTEPPLFEETSTVLVIDGTTGRNLFRVRSARLNYGDELGGARWLADSSGLVMQTKIGGRVGYSFVSGDGSRLEPLPEPPGPSGEWFQHPNMRGAAPAPDDPSLIAFGRTDVYDRASGRWMGMNPTEAAPAHVGPWGGDGSNEVVLALPHQPHRMLPLLADLDETRIEHNLPSEGDDA